MASYEQTIIIGNVGRDPEMRYLVSGRPVCSFSVAVSKKWTDKNTQEKKEKTKWYRVSVWGDQAEVANKFVTKGMQIMVVGEMDEPKAYMDKAGQPACSLELTASQFTFLGQKGDSNGNSRYEDDDSVRDTKSVDDIPF